MALVAISTSTFGEHDPAPLETLRAAGFEVRRNPHRRRLETHETLELVTGAAGLIAGTERLDRELLAAVEGLRRGDRALAAALEGGAFQNGAAAA